MSGSQHGNFKATLQGLCAWPAFAISCLKESVSQLITQRHEPVCSSGRSQCLCPMWGVALAVGAAKVLCLSKAHKTADLALWHWSSCVC